MTSPSIHLLYIRSSLPLIPIVVCTAASTTDFFVPMPDLPVICHPDVSLNHTPHTASHTMSLRCSDISSSSSVAASPAAVRDMHPCSSKTSLPVSHRYTLVGHTMLHTSGILILEIVSGTSDSVDPPEENDVYTAFLFPKKRSPCSSVLFKDAVPVVEYGNYSGA